MRKFTPILLAFLFFCLNLNAQLSGTKAIPGDYATIAQAITALNSQGVGSGGVTFNIAAGYTETITATLSITATGTSTNQIIFQKSGSGANPLITSYTTGSATPTSAIPDGIIALNGSDYITFDGIDLLDNTANTTTATTMEYGFGLFKASATDGCQYNTIKNCTITLNRVNNTAWTYGHNGSLGIAIHNTTSTAATTGLTPTAASGTNSYNKFYGNTIQNCNAGISFNGFAATTPFTLGDTGNDVGGAGASTGNIIKNFGGGASATNPANGIFAKDQWGLNCSYNTINSNDGSGVNHPNVLRGIYLNPSSTSASVTVNNNAVTIKGSGTTHTLSGIEVSFGSTAASNIVNINNNTVTGDYLTATSGVFYGIYFTATPSTLNIKNNTVSNISYSAATLAGSGAIYSIYITGVGITNDISGNTVSNITRTGTTGGTTIGIYVSSGTNGTNTISVKKNKVNNMSIDGTGSTSTMYGIQVSSGTVIVDSNRVNNLSCLKTAGTGTLYGIYDVSAPNNENFNYDTVYALTHAGTGTVYGLYTNTTTGIRTVSNNLIYNLLTGGTTIAGIGQLSSVPSIYNNKIYDIQSNATAAPTVSGIFLSSSTTGTAKIYNNIIGDIKAPNATSSSILAASVRGINITSTSATTNVEVSFNSIYLNATSTGTLFSTTALYASTSATATTAALTLRNNNFVNKSTPNGTGVAAAYIRSSTTLTNYAGLSNNNNFYAGTPSANNLIYYDGTNADQTITDFKNRVTTRETNSFSENPTFVSTTGTDGSYLHVSTTVPTQLDGGATSIAGITTDFDGELRGSVPDVGADEFTGIPIDLTPPTITYTALPTQTICTTSNTITATITDASGINVTPGLKPRLWFKKSTESDVLPANNTSASNGWKWVEATNNTSPFSFSFNLNLLTSTLNIGDSISYFVVAQDSAGTPNVGASVVTFATAPSSVALNGGSFPTSGSIKGYIVINPPVPLLVKTNKSEACKKDRVTLDVDGVVVAGGEFQWQSSPSGANTFTNIVGATTVPYTTDSLTASTDFRLVVSCGGTPIASSPSNVITFVVNNPSVTSTTPGVRCGAGSVNLSATAPGYDINWYANATGGSSIGTGNTFSTPIINSSTTYYVGASSGGASGTVGPLNPSSVGTISASAFAIGTYYQSFDVISPTTLVSIDVFPTAAVGTSASISVANSSGTILATVPYTVTDASGTVAQTITLNIPLPVGTGYRIGQGGTAINLNRNTTGAVYPYTSPVINVTGNNFSTAYWYYIYNWQFTSACDGTRVPVLATVNTAPSITVNSLDTVICNSATATLNVSSSNSNYVYTWTTPTGTLSGASVSVAPTENTKYYVNALDNGTTCTAIDSISVIVQPVPTLSLTRTTLCATGVSTLNLTPSTGYAANSIKWQNSTNNVLYTDISGATSATYTTPTLTATTYYKVMVKNGAGATCTELSDSVVVNNPAIVTTTPASRCGTGTVNLNATAPGYDVKWYAAATGGVPLASGNAFTTPVISSTTTYYVGASTVGTPEYVGRPIPISGAGTNLTTYGEDFTITTDLTLNSVDVYSAGGTAITISLYSANGAAQLQTSGSQTVTAGTSTTPLVSTIPLGWTLAPGTYRLMATGMTGNFIRENSSVTYPIALSTYGQINGFVSSITASISTSSSYYFMYNWNVTAGCEGTRTAVTASIVSPPAITKSATPASVCAGQSSSLSVSSTNNGYTYLWTPGNLTGASQTVTPSETTKYYVAATDISGGTYNGCANLDSVTITVNPVPSSVSITASATTICNTSGSAALLTASGGTIGGEYSFGTGTSQNTTSSYPAPYSAYYGGQRMQMLITASELTSLGMQAGTISKISFPVVSLGSNWGGALTSCNSFQISIGATSLTSLSSFQTGLTQVLAPADYTPVVGYNNTHTFTTPFVWDGTSNLIIETSFGNGITGTVNDAVIQYNTATSYQSTIVYRADGINAADAAAGTTVSVSYSARLDFKLLNSQPTTFAWTPLTGLFTDAAATIAYTGTNLTSVYAKPSVTTLYTATSSSSVPCSTSGTQNIVVDCSSVPVTLLNFNGERRTGFNILSWTTATEVNNAGFELERSNDGLSFSKIASIASKSANGNSNQQLSYSFNDYNQLSVNAYYRLKQLDKNGKFYYSAVVLIKAGKATQIEIVSIYPNPVKNELNIKIASPVNDKVELQLTDISGKVLVRREVSLMSGDNVFNIPVAQFAQGVYLIKTICANGCESAVKKFVKE